MDQESDREEAFDMNIDVTDLDFAALNNTSETNSPCTPVDLLCKDENDYRELQKANNIMRAAYKELMTIAFNAKTWVSSIPVVGSIEEFLEMFHTPPHHGSRVECSIESAVLPIPPEVLISIMMDGEKWASNFSHIICNGSSEPVLGPLRTSNVVEENIEVILVHAEIRLPATFLPRWNTCFVRFKKIVRENIWAIVDMSVDYLKDTTSDTPQKIEYKRRPSGVIIRQHDCDSEIIWIENAEVQEFDVPRNINSTPSNSNFSLSAKRWVSILSQKLKRVHNMYNAVGAFTQGIAHLLTLAENLQTVYLETVNPFPSERTCDLLYTDKIRISKDIRANCLDSRYDYIASSTFHIPETPNKLFNFLTINNAKFQWPSKKSPRQLETMAEIVAKDYSNHITLQVIAEPIEDPLKDRDFFLQETSLNEYCSFVVSTQLVGSDVRASVIYGHCDTYDFLKPSGFAIMPAGPGGLQSESSLLTVCIRRELNIMEDNQAIKAMNCHLNAVIGYITRCNSLNLRDLE